MQNVPRNRLMEFKVTLEGFGKIGNALKQFRDLGELKENNILHPEEGEIRYVWDAGWR